MILSFFCVILTKQ